MVNCGRTLDAHARNLLSSGIVRSRSKWKKSADYTEQRFHHPRAPSKGAKRNRRLYICWPGSFA